MDSWKPRKLDPGLADEILKSERLHDVDHEVGPRKILDQHLGAGERRRVGFFRQHRYGAALRLGLCLSLLCCRCVGTRGERGCTTDRAFQKVSAAN